MSNKQIGNKNSLTQRGVIVKKYLAKHIEMPSLTLAKLLHNDYPALWSTPEDARTIVRYYRGATGNSARKNIDKSLPFLGTGKVAGFIPEQSQDYEPVIIKGARRIGVISDLHIPNHRNTPIQLAIDKFKEINIDTLIINGDLLDNTPFTKHDCKPPNISDVKKWFDMTERFLEYLRDTFPKARIIWTEGNHDHWYVKWMYRHAAILSDDAYYSLTERLHLADYKIEFIDEKKYIMLGKLSVAHGHHIVKGLFMPVNGARGVYLRAKVSCMIGHVHAESSHTQTDLRGDIVTCWSTGCLCTLTPDYQPMGGNANHGFATVAVNADGDFSVSNYRIHRGKLL